MVKNMLQKITRKLKTFYLTKIKHMSLSEINLENYRKAGITIGKGCIFCSPLPVWRDSCLLSFGDNVLVSGNVTFLMHDAAPTTVSKGMGTDILGRVNIGSNVFIGAYSIIMPGVSLADYTVVGAGSVVTHSIDKPGYIVAGNPARVVCTVEEYLKKNEKHIVNLDGMDLNDIKKLAEQKEDTLIKKSSFKV